MSSSRSPHLPAGAPEPDLLARESLPRAWVEWFARTPDAPAVVAAASGETLTYGELDARSRVVAGRLWAAGLRAGDRVLLSAAASLHLVVAYVAAQRLGLVIVPVNSAYTQREVDHIIGDADPQGAIVDQPEQRGWMAALDVVCGPEVDLPDGTAAAPPATGSAAGRDDAAGEDAAGVNPSGGERSGPLLDASTRDDLALIAYTSGTTGAPKGAMLSSGNLLASAEAVRIAWRWTPTDRLVLALPLFHIHGLGVGLHGTLTAGASALLLPKFEVDAVLDAARGASMFFGVPTMYARLADSERVGELAHLRLCVSGSAPLPAALHEVIEARGGQRVLERYGMTETIMNVSNPYDGERRAGSVGLPLPGVELRLADDGEIELRGPNVFAGYWQRPDATADSFTADGWFRTGDLGRLADDGYLTIDGRSKELIISGGYNVYPREVEDVLRAHPAVSDVAVAGIPSQEWGETVGAWVVADGELSDGDLIAFSADKLASYKRPRAVRFVDELPRNALGKVVKGELPRG